MAIKGKRIFLLSLLLVTGVLAYFAFPQTWSHSFRPILRSILPPEQSFLQSSIKFTGKKLAIQVVGSSKLAPTADSDFVLAFWVRFNRPPEAGRSYTLVQKLAALDSNQHQGFLFDLNRDRSGIRPVVSWYSKPALREPIFRFYDLKFYPKSWTLFVLGVKEGRYLLVRAVSVRDNKPLDIQNLGAYDLRGFKNISSESDLFFGSLKAGLFHGDFGPLMVVTGQGLIDRLDSLVTTLVGTPNQAPVLMGTDRLELRVVPNPDDLVDQLANSNLATE